MNDFQDRMKAVLDKYGAKKISNDTGISRTQLYRLCEPNRDTTRGNMLRICESTGVSFLWLGKGEGPMHLGSDENPEPTQSESENLSNDELELLELFRNSSLMQKVQVVQLLSSQKTSAEPLPEPKSDVPANEEQPQ